ncbi:hypothetical protein [Streptomyces sp. TRM68416]|uniref:hypothetical protein n=1 Tax=Streptomyces sp. TRM68416 TaxID=2758412 RepID=UPI002948C1E4|nr:hypothetical protein [Streptomyces sp. TRM68416]
MIPEPALRPRGARGPGVELCHTARLFVDGGDLVLRTRGRTVRHPVGAAGIARAVFVDAAGEDAERMGPTIPGSWGQIQFQDRDGALIGSFDVEDWLPESPVLPKRAVRGEELLRVTGITDLLKAAGIPLHRVQDRDDPLVAAGSRTAGGGSFRPGGSLGSGRSLGPGGDFPSWYWWTRLVAGGVWFAAISVVILSGSRSPWLILLAAIAAFVGPVARLVLRARTRTRLRRHDPVVRARIEAAPAPGSGATVRFCRDTGIRVQDRDLVLCFVGGQECWFPLAGPHALTSLVLVRDRAGAATGVEICGPGGHVRAVLPWPLWFGGPGGAEGWSRLRGATGLTVSERRLSGRTPWPKQQVLGAQPLPESGRAARRTARFPSTIAGLSSTAVMALGAFFSVSLGLSIEDAHPAAGTTAITLGALGGFLQATPYAVHQLRSRLHLDRPAPEQNATEHAV